MLLDIIGGEFLEPIVIRSGQGDARNHETPGEGDGENMPRYHGAFSRLSRW
jgi:hypothetical protein